MHSDQLTNATPSHRHVMSCHVISYHIISYHIISYHIISYHIISYHIISYHIISCHIISYYMAVFDQSLLFVNHKNCNTDINSYYFHSINYMTVYPPSKEHSAVWCLKNILNEGTLPGDKR